MFDFDDFAAEYVRRFAGKTPEWRRLNTYIGEWNETQTALTEAFNELAYDIYFRLFDAPELDVVKDTLNSAQFERFDAAIEYHTRRWCATQWCREFNEGRDFWRWLMHG